jgi:hypothetical protein
VPHRFTLVTPVGRREDPSDDEVGRAVEAAQAVDGGFVVLERDDGAFVQFDGRVLEWNPGVRLQRFDLGPRAKSAFARFARGEDVSTTEPWRDVQHEVARAEEARRRGRRLTMWMLLAVAVAGGLLLRWLKGHL